MRTFYQVQRSTGARSFCGVIELVRSVGHDSVYLVDERTGRRLRKVGMHFCRNPGAPKRGEILKIRKGKLDNDHRVDFDYFASYYPADKTHFGGFFHKAKFPRGKDPGDWEAVDGGDLETRKIARRKR